MRLNEDLLERVDELFELITNEQDSEDLDFAMNSLRQFIEKDIDGWTNFSEGELALAVQNSMEELWDLISDQEKRENYLIEEYYEDIMVDLEVVSGYESGAGIEKEVLCEDDSEDCFEDGEEESWD